MSEEILYIDDGELVYYINENEFITCDEIPYPMLEGIKHLQQKVEQLEKENEYLKMNNPEQNMEHFRIINENKRKIDMLRKENHQLKNIIKESIESIERGYVVFCEQDKECLLNFRKNMLNILNKGSDKK